MIGTIWVGVGVGLPSLLHILCGNLSCNSDSNSEYFSSHSLTEKGLKCMRKETKTKNAKSKDAGIYKIMIDRDV